VLIVDGHLDLAWNALQWNRDLLCSVHTTRTRELEIAGPGRGQGTVALPELRRGRVGLCFATLLARSTGRAKLDIDYSSPIQAYGIAQGQLAYYRALEEQGHVRIITDAACLNRHIAEWDAYDALPDAQQDNSPPIGLVICMESADPVLSPAQVRQWWEGGVRIIGPAHYGPGRYAGGTGTEQGLTSEGCELLVEMERLGIILDLTHLSDRSFWQALERFGATVLASHNNCRTLVAHQRQFSDDQLQAIVARNGVIGVAFDAWMLQPGWVVGVTTNERVRLSTVIDHIDYVCQLSGNCRHAALGTDLDGGFGQEQSPRDLDTIADLGKVQGLLAKRGYSDEDSRAILHGNWLRLLRRAWSGEKSDGGSSTSK